MPLMPCPPSLRRTLLALAFGIPTLLHGQVPYNGCVDRAGVRIVGTVRNDVPGGAQASRENGVPVVYWNQGNMEWARAVTQLFVYLHECGHHALGHLWKPSDAQHEKDADCWAMEMLVDGGMIGGTDQGMLERDLIDHFPGDGFHLSGEQTVRSTHACIAARTDKRLWRLVLDSLVAGVPDTLDEFVGARIREDTSTVRYESRLEIPGNFECEIAPTRIFRCPAFASPSERRAKGRFEQLMGIIQEWLPSSWTATEVPGRGYIKRQFVAEDGRTGARITLALTDAKTVFFIFQPITE